MPLHFIPRKASVCCIWSTVWFPRFERSLQNNRQWVAWSFMGRWTRCLIRMQDASSPYPWNAERRQRNELLSTKKDPAYLRHCFIPKWQGRVHAARFLPTISCITQMNKPGAWLARHSPNACIVPRVRSPGNPENSLRTRYRAQGSCRLKGCKNKNPTPYMY